MPHVNRSVSSRKNFAMTVYNNGSIRTISRLFSF